MEVGKHRKRIEKTTKIFGNPCSKVLYSRKLKHFKNGNEREFNFT